MLVDWDSFLEIVVYGFDLSVFACETVWCSCTKFAVSNVFRVKNQYWTHLKTLSKHLSASIWLLLLFNCGLVNVGCLNCLLFTELMNSSSTNKWIQLPINGALSRELLNFAIESSESICSFFLCCLQINVSNRLTYPCELKAIKWKHGERNNWHKTRKWPI